MIKTQRLTLDRMKGAKSAGVNDLLVDLRETATKVL